MKVESRKLVGAEPLFAPIEGGHLPAISEFLARGHSLADLPYIVEDPAQGPNVGGDTPVTLDRKELLQMLPEMDADEYTLAFGLYTTYVRPDPEFIEATHVTKDSVRYVHKGIRQDLAELFLRGYEITAALDEENRPAFLATLAKNFSRRFDSRAFNPSIHCTRNALYDILGHPQSVTDRSMQFGIDLLAALVSVRHNSIDRSYRELVRSAETLSHNPETLFLLNALAEKPP